VSVCAKLFRLRAQPAIRKGPALNKYFTHKRAKAFPDMSPFIIWLENDKMTGGRREGNLTQREKESVMQF